MRKRARDWQEELPPSWSRSPEAADRDRERPDGIDLKLEAELAELGDDEARVPGRGQSALGEVVRAGGDARPDHVLHGGDEGDARLDSSAGQTAIEAAATIHSDIARGFIRCEVIRWDDLVAAARMRRPRARAKQRLEGKTYVVEDGDVLNVRFNV
jgi:hypothetical protein